MTAEKKEEFKNSTDKFLHIIWRIFTSLTALIWFFTDYHVSKTSFLFMYLSFSVLIISTIVILFRKGFGAERFAYLFITVVLSIFLYKGYLDVPAYLTQSFEVAEGVPAEFEHESSGFKGGSYLRVKLDGELFALPPNISETYSDRWFIIEYLPHSNMVMKYELLSEKETLEKQSGEEQ